MDVENHWSLWAFYSIAAARGPGPWARGDAAMALRHAFGALGLPTVGLPLPWEA